MTTNAATGSFAHTLLRVLKRMTFVQHSRMRATASSLFITLGSVLRFTVILEGRSSSSRLAASSSSFWMEAAQPMKPNCGSVAALDVRRAPAERSTPKIERHSPNAQQTVLRACFAQNMQPAKWAANGRWPMLSPEA
eukprot:107150-Prymnesium_polylepis.2